MSKRQVSKRRQNLRKAGTVSKERERKKKAVKDGAYVPSGYKPQTKDKCPFKDHGKHAR